MKPRRTRRWLIFITVFTTALLVGVVVWAFAQPDTYKAQACPPNCMVTFDMPSIMEPASYEAARVDVLLRAILIMAGIVFVVVEAMLIFTVLRFRNRPPETAMQFHGNTKLEMAWTAAPGVILAILLGFTLQTMAEVRAVGAGDPLRVTVIGHRWWWEFRYPDLGIVTANELVVPVNTVVEVAVESVDVEHSFWAPELFGKMDAVPGQTNRLRFTPTVIRSDYFGGQCAEFCGGQHAQMRFAVVVRSAADFQAWAAQNQQDAAAEITGDAAAGRELFLASQCVGCHMINGTAAAGQVGPNLTHLASRGFIAGGVLANTPENLHAWIKNPQVIKPGAQMPNLGLSDDQVADLVAYLVTLK